MLQAKLSLKVSSHYLSLLNTPLSRDVASTRILSSQKLSELIHERGRAPNCKNEVIVILICIIVRWPDSVIRVGLLLALIEHVPCKVVPLVSIYTILSGVFSEDVSLSDHVAGDPILLIVANHSSPDSVDVGRCIERTFISCELSSIEEGQWVKCS